MIQERQILIPIIEFASCTFLLFALLLWIQRGDNRSRKFFAIAYVVCGIDLFLRIFKIRDGIPDSFETLNPGYIYMALIEVPLFLFYIIEVVHPGWLSWRRIGTMSAPWLCWNVFMIIPGLHFRELGTFGDLFQYIGEFNVWLRLLFVLLILPYSYMIYHVPYNWQRSSADLRLIRFYGAGFIIMALFFILSSLTGSWIVSCLHLLYGMCFCFYLAYNELFLRLRIPAEQTEENGAHCETGRSVVPPPSRENAAQTDELTETASHDRWNAFAAKMEESKLWQNPDITLPVLAKALGTNRTTLSAEIHAHGYAHLSDFIARYRIRAICRMIDNGGINSMDDAFFEVGYRSRSVAFNNFKKQTGMTPGQYIKMKCEKKKMP